MVPGFHGFREACRLRSTRGYNPPPLRGGAYKTTTSTGFAARRAGLLHPWLQPVTPSGLPACAGLATRYRLLTTLAAAEGRAKIQYV